MVAGTVPLRCGGGYPTFEGWRVPYLGDVREGTVVWCCDGGTVPLRCG